MTCFYVSVTLIMTLIRYTHWIVHVLTNHARIIFFESFSYELPTATSMCTQASTTIMNSAFAITLICVRATTATSTTC